MVCRSTADDTNLQRASRNAVGEWTLGRGSGRGVWWCVEGPCGDQLARFHLARALRSEVTEEDVEVVQVLWRATKVAATVEE